jgi:Fe2+ or Zn2+ uptake regulation protein
MLEAMPRPSPVRDALRACLTEHPRHGWSLDELLAELHAESVSADFSTVFRALNWLEAEGEVRRVDLGDGKARYEAPRDHHEHVRCIQCGSIAEVPGCVVDEAAAGIEARTGYAVQSHQVVFAGLCPNCRPATAASPAIATRR